MAKLLCDPNFQEIIEDHLGNIINFTIQALLFIKVASASPGRKLTFASQNIFT